MNIKGQIQAYDGEYLTIIAPYDKSYIMEQKEIIDCEIRLNDGRRISNAQRRKIFALVSDIGSFAYGLSKSKDREYIEILRQLKLQYIIDKTDNEAIRRVLTYRYCDLLDIDIFSLSDVDMTTARGFIDWLIELCITFDIPTNDTLLDLCEDINRYMYLCVAKRKCCICGKKADIHEVEKVGMGKNRARMHHLNQLVQPLCRKHHMEEEQIGQKAFDKKYHLSHIRLDENLCKLIGWRK